MNSDEDDFAERGAFNVRRRRVQDDFSPRPDTLIKDVLAMGFSLHQVNTAVAHFGGTDRSTPAAVVGYILERNIDPNPNPIRRKDLLKGFFSQFEAGRTDAITMSYKDYCAKVTAKLAATDTGTDADAKLTENSRDLYAPAPATPGSSGGALANGSNGSNGGGGGSELFGVADVSVRTARVNRRVLGTNQTGSRVPPVSCDPKSAAAGSTATAAAPGAAGGASTAPHAHAHFSERASAARRPREQRHRLPKTPFPGRGLRDEVSEAVRRHDQGGAPAAIVPTPSRSIPTPSASRPTQRTQGSRAVEYVTTPKAKGASGGPTGGGGAPTSIVEYGAAAGRFALTPAKRVVRDDDTDAVEAMVVKFSSDLTSPLGLAAGGKGGGNREKKRKEKGGGSAPRPKSEEEKAKAEGAVPGGAPDPPPVFAAGTGIVNTDLALFQCDGVFRTAGSGTELVDFDTIKPTKKSVQEQELLRRRTEIRDGCTKARDEAIKAKAKAASNDDEDDDEDECILLGKRDPSDPSFRVGTLALGQDYFVWQNRSIVNHCDLESNMKTFSESNKWLVTGDGARTSTGYDGLDTKNTFTSLDAYKSILKKHALVLNDWIHNFHCDEVSMGRHRDTYDLMNRHPSTRLVEWILLVTLGGGGKKNGKKLVFSDRQHVKNRTPGEMSIDCPSGTHMLLSPQARGLNSSIYHQVVNGSESSTYIARLVFWDTSSPEQLKKDLMCGPGSTLGNDVLVYRPASRDTVPFMDRCRSYSSHWALLLCSRFTREEHQEILKMNGLIPESTAIRGHLVFRGVVQVNDEPLAWECPRCFGAYQGPTDIWQWVYRAVGCGIDEPGWKLVLPRHQCRGPNRLDPMEKKRMVATLGSSVILALRRQGITVIAWDAADYLSGKEGRLLSSDAAQARTDVANIGVDKGKYCMEGACPSCDLIVLLSEARADVEYITCIKKDGGCGKYSRASGWGLKNLRTGATKPAKREYSTNIFVKPCTGYGDQKGRCTGFSTSNGSWYCRPCNVVKSRVKRDKKKESKKNQTKINL